MQGKESTSTDEPNWFYSWTPVDSHSTYVQTCNIRTKMALLYPSQGDTGSRLGSLLGWCSIGGIASLGISAALFYVARHTDTCIMQLDCAKPLETLAGWLRSHGSGLSFRHSLQTAGDQTSLPALHTHQLMRCCGGPVLTRQPCAPGFVSLLAVVAQPLDPHAPALHLHLSPRLPSFHCSCCCDRGYAANAGGGARAANVPGAHQVRAQRLKSRNAGGEEERAGIRSLGPTAHS